MPADNPVTKPVEAPTVDTPKVLPGATLKVTLDQVPPLVASDNWVVEPTHSVDVPVIAATVGKATTVTVCVTEFVQPPLVTV